MDSFFTTLGRTVGARWQARNFSLAAFPEIAVAALREQPPAEHVEVAALLRDFLFNDAQPTQTQSGFGQPELVVYEDPRFYIQVLCWLDGTTDIHQHEFSGAFHVLAGSSIHSQFVFERAEAISAHLRVGTLRRTSTALLEAGRTEPIVSGRDYIHALFHLDTPSLTVVVRTQHDPGTGPQFTYLPPHLAVDPVHSDTLTMRRKQLLDLLETTGDPSYGVIVREMLATLDFERGVFVLQNCFAALRHQGEWEETWRVFVKKHGRLARFVAPTLEEIIRRDGLVALRGAITDVEHRYFLALLLNVSERPEILRLVRQRFPGDPARTILRWVEELCEEHEGGTGLLDADLPGIDTARLLAALRHFLGGGPAPLPAAKMKRLRAACAGSSLRALLG
jgi:hypothetical protein